MKSFVLNFGSYRGRTISEVYKTDPAYIEWLRFQDDSPAQRAAEEFIHEENQRIINRGRQPCGSST